MSSVLKSKAIYLRRSGFLYSEIATELNISKSTAHLWTSKIDLNEVEIRNLQDRLLGVKRNHVKNLVKANALRQKQLDLSIESSARKVVSKARLNSEHTKLLAAIMFWCEGGKDTRSGIRFMNSDPVMVKAFLSLLRNSFELEEARFKALVHLHSYHNPRRQLIFWSKVTGIPRTQFYKPYLKLNSGKNKRENYPGCISVRYSDSSLGKLLKMIYIEFSRNT